MATTADQAMQALQSALGRIAALETEVSSQRTRAEAVEGQVAVQRAALDQAEKLLTAAAAAEQQQRSQIASLTETLKQQLATQAELGTAMQAILARGVGSTNSSSTSLIDTRLLASPATSRATRTRTAAVLTAWCGRHGASPPRRTQRPWRRAWQVS